MHFKFGRNGEFVGRYSRANGKCNARGFTQGARPVAGGVRSFFFIFDVTDRMIK